MVMMVMVVAENNRCGIDCGYVSSVRSKHICCVVFVHYIQTTVLPHFMSAIKKRKYFMLLLALGEYLTLLLNGKCMYATFSVSKVSK